MSGQEEEEEEEEELNDDDDDGDDNDNDDADGDDDDEEEKAVAVLCWSPRRVPELLLHERMMSVSVVGEAGGAEVEVLAKEAAISASRS